MTAEINRGPMGPWLQIACASAGDLFLNLRLFSPMGSCTLSSLSQNSLFNPLETCKHPWFLQECFTEKAVEISLVTCA